ncbi:MAG: hypothetical protein CM15mP18_0270 [Methanobacteriota archaeon]|nr:MAG: hypothetical protein CM15mP18_0270 [Euryarchaeota archaeon]
MSMIDFARRFASPTVDVDAVWDAIQLLTDAVHVPKGKHLPAVQQHNLFGDAFNLTQDVAADQDRAAHSAKLPDHVHDRGPCEGVTSREGLVEHDEVGVIDQGVGNFHPLPHALRIAPDLGVHHVLQVHEIEHPFGFDFCFIARETVQPCEGGHEIEGGHPIVEFFRFGHEANPSVGRGVLPRVDAEQANLTGGRLATAHQEVEQGRFPCAVEPKDTRHAARDGQIDLTQRMNPTVGFPNAIEDHRGNLLRNRFQNRFSGWPNLTEIRRHSRVTSMLATRLASRYRESTFIATTETSDHVHGMS